jgi:hypothetical protein
MTNIYLPPRYNLYGNRQVWFFETGNKRLDEPLNGALLALVVFWPLLVLFSLA